MIKFSKSLIVCSSFCLALAASQSFAQDAVYVNKIGGGVTRVTGAISEVTPEGVKIDDRNISANEISRISIGKEPSAINRLREEMKGGQYAECLAGINKLSNVPDEPLLQKEIAFMKAFSSARLSLTQGTISNDAAEKIVLDFVKSAPNSLHLYPAIEQYGRLVYSGGKPELAARAFDKLRTAKWEEYRLRGQFLHGRMMSVMGQQEKAKADYEQILQEPSTSDEAEKFKLLARSEKARANGVTGDPSSSLKELDKLIQSQSDNNAELFAHLYNSKGAIYEKTGDLKEARDAYLHTQLLFGSIEDPAAEALSRLSEIFAKLNDPKRANDSKRELQTKYRNSYWRRVEK